MFRASPMLRSSGRILGARFASPRPSPITQRPLYQTTRLASSSGHPPNPPPSNKEHDKHLPKKLESSEHVSTTSSVRSVFEPSESPNKDAVNVHSSLKHDIDIVKDTFRLDTVPRESHILGLSGTVPYLATSLSTVFLAWNLNSDVPNGNRILDHILLEHETAQYLLDVIEPLQLGYGAVIISFLGAIHWGLEYAEKKPEHNRTRFRYGIGLGASIVAWPTLLMPLEYALTTQFGAFVALYYADSRATKNGWAPPWYAKYRFLLTAMVGLSIFVSLIGRAKITKRGELNQKSLKARLEGPGIADRETNWSELEKEEMDRIRKEKAKKAREEGQAEKRRQQEEKKAKENGDGKDKKGEKDDGEDSEKENGEGESNKDEDKKDDAEDSQRDGADDNDKSKDNGESKQKPDEDSKPAKGDKDSKKKK
ncbi:hypothetical protein GGI43DRAFT_79396 [Trichoderma evansii]